MGPPQARKFWAFLHLLGAFGASFCAEMVKNAQNFRACGGQGGLRRPRPVDIKFPRYRLFSRKMPFLCPHPDGPRGHQHAFVRLSVLKT